MNEEFENKEAEKKLEDIYRSILEEIRETCPDAVPFFVHECEKFESFIKTHMNSTIKITALLFFLSGCKSGLAQASSLVDKELQQFTQDSIKDDVCPYCGEPAEFVGGFCLCCCPGNTGFNSDE